MANQIKQYVQDHKTILLGKALKNTWAGLTTLLKTYEYSQVKAQPEYDDDSVFSLSTTCMDQALHLQGEPGVGVDIPLLDESSNQVSIAIARISYQCAI